MTVMEKIEAFAVDVIEPIMGVFGLIVVAGTYLFALFAVVGVGTADAADCNVRQVVRSNYSHHVARNVHHGYAHHGFHNERVLYLVGAEAIQEAAITRAVEEGIAKALENQPALSRDASAGTVSTLCAKCHKPGGSAATELNTADAYLAFDEMLTGERDVPKAMKSLVESITDEQVAGVKADIRKLAK